MISNNQPKNATNIIEGNERVLRARLSDAKFFFEQDKKKRLETRTPLLSQVVYHNKLGSQLERVERLQRLSGNIARLIDCSVVHAQRAAWLCKADLLTDMVGEFPELQGTMGYYYARHDQEPEDVAQAIREHYQPRFAGDRIPQHKISACLALADKLDTLVGIYGVGLIPTGDKDPFALRRHALGILRILIETPLALELSPLLTQAAENFKPGILREGTPQILSALYVFILERLHHYLRERDFSPQEIDAVLTQQPERIDRVLPRLKALQNFRSLPESSSLSQANKRIQNILKQTENTLGTTPQPHLFSDPAEKKLFNTLTQLEPQVSLSIEKQRYADALKSLTHLHHDINHFFNEVMVMCEDTTLRNNRLALLHQLHRLMNQVADISKLV